jgi:hypothetical protein
MDARRPDGRRDVCRECKRQRHRELHPEPDEEPAPAPTPRTHQDRMTLVPVAELDDREHRRRLLDDLRANGVETELRDGQVFRVLHLPAVMPNRPPAGTRTQLRVPHASRIA